MCVQPSLVLTVTLIQLYNFLGHSLLSPFECLCGNFILPEPASYVFFYAVFNLRIVHYPPYRIQYQNVEEYLRSLA